MDLPRSWRALLADRGIDAADAHVARFEDRESTDVFRIDIPERHLGPGAKAAASTWVVRRHRAVRGGLVSEAALGELECELAAASFLAAAGFPTPAPLPSRSTGSLFEIVDGTPTTVWSYRAGHHPTFLTDGYGSDDRGIGPEVARMLGSMHVLLAGTALPGARSDNRIPWVAVDRFLASELRSHPVFQPLIAPLLPLHKRTRIVHMDPGDLPLGLVHNDVNPGNLLLDDDGRITALLDFGDSMQTLLAYELASTIANFAITADHHLDVAAARLLVSAYDEARPLAPEERRLLPDLLALHAAAETITVLSDWINEGREDLHFADSFSARQFADLIANGSDLTQERVEIRPCTARDMSTNVLGTSSGLSEP